MSPQVCAGPANLNWTSVAADKNMSNHPLKVTTWRHELALFGALRHAGRPWSHIFGVVAAAFTHSSLAVGMAQDLRMREELVAVA